MERQFMNHFIIIIIIIYYNYFDSRQLVVKLTRRIVTSDTLMVKSTT
jgi:hypothetical protein